MKLIVGGAGGRMGRAILGLANRSPELRIVGAFERSDHPTVGRDVGELIVGCTGHDLTTQSRHCVLVQHAAKRTGGENVAFDFIDLAG